MAAGNGGGGHAEEENEEDTLTACSLNLGKVIIGAGVMALPAALAFRTGLLLGAALLAAVAAVTYSTLAVLVDGASSVRGGAASYAELTEALLGKGARRVLQAAIVVFCFGFEAVYLVIIVDVVVGPPPPAPCGGLACELVPGLRPARWAAVAAVSAFVVAPLLLLRRQEQLRALNSAGVGAVALLAASSLGLGAAQVARLGASKALLPFLWPTAQGQGQGYGQGQEHGGGGGLQSGVSTVAALLATVVPILLASYIAHQSVLPLRPLLRPYTDRRMRGVCARALAITFATYLALSVGAAAAFGGALEVDALQNFSAEGIAATGLLSRGSAAAAALSWAVRLAFLASLLGSLLLYFHPLRAGLAEIVFGGGDSAEEEEEEGGGGGDAEAPLLGGGGGGGGAGAAAATAEAGDGDAPQGAVAAPPAPLRAWQRKEQRHYLLLTYGLLLGTTAAAASTDNIFTALSAIGDLASTIQGLIVPGALAVVMAWHGGGVSGSSGDDSNSSSGSSKAWSARRRLLRGGAGAVVLLVGAGLFLNGVVVRV